MEQETQLLLNDVNRAIIKFRGIYSEWSKKHNISYNEMLVLYTIRENGYCTQKQICENYLLPKQTVHHVVASMVRAGWLLLEPSIRSGREKRLVPTARGWERIRQVMEPLTRLETDAVERMGRKEVAEMVRLMERYSGQLNPVAEEEAV